MSKRRRESSFLLADVEPDIHIRIHGKDEPLRAHYDVLKLFSILVRDLPRDQSSQPTVWDLSGIVLEGDRQPVSAELVQLWLDLLYSRVDTVRRVALPSNLDGEARALLLFADAVGTGDAVMQELGSALASSPGSTLKVSVLTGEERKELQLRIDDAMYYCYNGTVWERCAPTPSDRKVSEGMDPHALQPAVAAALEDWLALAGRLHLVPLVRKLMAFAKTQMQCWTAAGMLGAAAARVLSPRVLKLLPPEILYEAVAWRFLQPETSDILLAPCEGLTAERLPSMLGSEPGNISLQKSPDNTRNTVAFSTGGYRFINFSFGGPGKQELGELVGGVVQRALEDEEVGPSQRQEG